MKPKNAYIVIIVLVLFVAGIACRSTGGDKPETGASGTSATQTESASEKQGSGDNQQAASTPVQTQPTAAQKTAAQKTAATVKVGAGELKATETERPQEKPASQEVIRQWGVGATASSQFGERDWSPSQATGAPDTNKCEDNPSAWASQMGGEQEWLEVYYESAVLPTEVNIYQTYGATQITSVELLDTAGKYHTIYTGKPVETECPFVMQVGIAEQDYEAAGVKISFDESFLHYWNEIDAVELVGVSTGKVVATAAARFATATAFAAPTGFLWRAGGESSPSGRFSVPGGVDVTADGTVYVADLMKGVILYDIEGHQMNLINTSEMDTLADVSVGPDGRIYVASWGNYSVLAYESDGTLLWAAGEEGKGPGQFALFSPQRLTVGPDGNVYVLDKNETADGEKLLRVEVFSPQGKYLREIKITEEWFTADDIDFGPDGNLYILSGFAQYILKLTAQGSVVGRIGNAALSDAYIYTGIEIDDQGFIYIASGHLEQGIMKLDRYGELVDRFGVDIEDGQRPWPEGGFYAPTGLGVSPDGSAVFVTDHSGPYAYLTAFTFK